MFKKYSYEDVLNEIKILYGQEYVILNNAQEANEYFEKYSYTKDEFSKELVSTLVCYSGDSCECVNDYLKNRYDGESTAEYDVRKRQWKKAIIDKCLSVLYNYDNWINLKDNVIAVRYLKLGKNKLQLSSQTLISCSLNWNIMSEVFAHNPYFNGAPYFMGEADTELFILMNKNQRFICYDQLKDYYAIKQSEVLLGADTKFEIVKKYKVSNNKIKNIFLLKIV